MSIFNELLDASVEVAACWYDKIPVSPDWRVQASDPNALARLCERPPPYIAIPATATQLVVEAIGDDALRRALVLADPLEPPPLLILADGRRLAIFTGDGALRAGEIGPDARVVPNFVVLGPRELQAARLDGRDRRPPLPEAIAVRLKTGCAAQRLAEADRRKLAEPILAEARAEAYASRDADHALYAAADQLRRLGFLDWEGEAALKEIVPVAVERIERATANVFSLFSAGADDTRASGPACAASAHPSARSRGLAGRSIGNGQEHVARRHGHRRWIGRAVLQPTVQRTRRRSDFERRGCR